MPGYKFECDESCGNITEWGVDVFPGGGQNQGTYTLDLQVWRPSPTVDESTGAGCYSLVGNNRFTSISLSNQVALVTPSPQDYIQFQSGDVLGFYVEEARQFDDGVVLVVGGNLARSRVWHASIAPSLATSKASNCPYSVGSDGILRNFIRGIAPVISIKTGKHQFNKTGTILNLDFLYPQKPILARHLKLCPRSLLLNQPLSLFHQQRAIIIMNELQRSRESIPICPFF